MKSREKESTNTFGLVVFYSVRFIFSPVVSSECECRRQSMSKVIKQHSTIQFVVYLFKNPGSLTLRQQIKISTFQTQNTEKDEEGGKSTMELSTNLS